MSKLSKDIFQTFIIQIPIYIFGIITGIFLARLLGPSGKGVLALFQANVQILVLFFSFSFNQVITYYFANRQIDRSVIIGIAFWVMILSLFVTAIICMIDYAANLTILPNLNNKIFIQIILICMVLFTIVHSFFVGAFQGVGKFRTVNKMSLLNSCANLLVFGVLYFISFYKIYNIDLFLVLLFSVLILFILSMIYTIFYLKQFTWKIQIKIWNYIPEIKIILKYVLFYHLAVLVNFFNYRFSLWIIHIYLNEEQLGIFSLALSFALMTLTLSNTISLVSFPTLTKNTIEESKILLSRYLRLNVSITLITNICLFFLSDYILPFFYGKEFNGAVVPFKILLIGTTFYAFAGNMSTFLLSRGITLIQLIICTIGLILTIILSLFLVPIWGINGASITSSIAYIFIFLALLIVLKNKYKFTIYELFVIKKGDLKWIKSLITRRFK